MIMKRIILGVLFLFCLLDILQAADFQSLYSRYLAKDYFRFRDELSKSIPSLSEWHRIYLSAIEKSIFGQFAEALDLSDSVLKVYTAEIHNSLKTELYR